MDQVGHVLYDSHVSLSLASCYPSTLLTIFNTALFSLSSLDGLSSLPTLPVVPSEL